MSDIINTETVDVVETTANATKYTLDYVLEQIENLQKQLTENSFHSLHRLEDTVYHIYEIDSESGSEERNSSVARVCEVFRNREETLQRMLSFYEKMYDDLKPKNPDPVNEAIKRIVAEFISQKINYVADKSHKINAEEFEAILNEIQQVSYLVK